MERSSESGDEELDRSCLLDKVVKIRRESVLGSRSLITFWSSAMVVEEGSGITRVEGNPRPAKVESKTLT